MNQLLASMQGSSTYVPQYSNVKGWLFSRVFRRFFCAMGRKSLSSISLHFFILFQRSGNGVINVFIASLLSGDASSSLNGRRCTDFITRISIGPSIMTSQFHCFVLVITFILETCNHYEIYIHLYCVYFVTQQILFYMYRLLQNLSHIFM